MSLPHHRRSIRLAGYDYTRPGFYFVTIVTQHRKPIFGEVVDGEMRLSRFGRVAHSEWQRLSRRFPHLELDEFVVMPNHIHGILIVLEKKRPEAGASDDIPSKEQFGKPVKGSLATIIRSYKSAVTARIHCMGDGVSGARVWLRNYYEHIVRGPKDLDRIRHYIRDNPLKWALDRENPKARR